MDATTNTVPPETRTRTPEHRLSKDGQWRSFPKVPNLLQYVSNGVYYARVKVSGKVFRRSLDTTTYSDAKLLLLDFLKEQRTAESVPLIEAPSLTFSQAKALYVHWLDTDRNLKPRSREYRHLCLQKITSSWRELADRPLESVSPQDCRSWASRLTVSSHYFNNVVGTLKQIFTLGIREYRRLGKETFENPVEEIARARVKQKQLLLPEPAQFRALVEEVRRGSSGWGPRAADLIEFLAVTGTRAFSEAFWMTWRDIDWTRNEFIVRGNPATGTKNGELRRVPILPDLVPLLERLRSREPHIPEDARILEVRECQGALTRACKKLGIHRLTHHDLRHLFATRCIEAGVDIPTVSRWMGHKDGGALAMKTYGHLRNEHSQEMARKVRF